MPSFYYGGQAVIEGVMMRGRSSAAVAVRAPDRRVVLHEERLESQLYRSPVARWPFIRGMVLLWETLILGTRMMLFASSVAQPADEHAEQPVKPAAASDPRVLLPMLFSLTFAVALFFLLPLGITGLLSHWLGTGTVSLLFEGLLRLGILIGYLALIGRLPDIQRVFQYHGAEHKAINAFEAGEPLDVAHVRAASRVHTRCGTGFLLIVVVISIILFALLGNPPLVWRVLSRIVLVPVIAGIGYELLRLGARFYHVPLVKMLMAPSLALQGLTTREPDDTQIECAITALDAVLRTDGTLPAEPRAA